MDATAQSCEGCAVAKEPQDSPVVIAAYALEAAIRRMEDTAKNFEQLVFNSEKNIERGAKLLQDVAGSSEAMDGELKHLIGALNEVRGRQEAVVRAISARSENLMERKQTYVALLQRYGTIGEAAAKLNGMIQAIAAQQPKGEAAREPLDALEQGMVQTAEEAHGLARAARDEDFGDLSRQAESLKQQLQAAVVKLKTLRDKLLAE